MMTGEGCLAAGGTGVVPVDREIPVPPIPRDRAMDLAERCRRVGLGPAELAPALGVAQRTVRRWLLGEDGMPPALEAVLEALLEFRGEATRPRSGE